MVLPPWILRIACEYFIQGLLRQALEYRFYHAKAIGHFREYRGRREIDVDDMNYKGIAEMARLGNTLRLRNKRGKMRVFKLSVRAMETKKRRLRGYSWVRQIRAFGKACRVRQSELEHQH